MSTSRPRKKTSSKSEAAEGTRGLGPLTALVVAAGSGQRLRGSRGGAGDSSSDDDRGETGKPKGFRSLGGIPLFLHSLSTFDRARAVTDLVLVVPAGREEEARRTAAGVISKRLEVVAGGPRRQDSVLRGLEAAAALDEETATPSGSALASRIVAVHDAARPFVTVDLIERCADAARSLGAAVPLVSVNDTVRREGADGRAELLDRSALKLAQTPQVARLDWLLRGYEAASREGAVVTDEGAALEHAGFSWSGVEGSPSNLKITTEEDLEVAEALVIHERRKRGGVARVGFGEDRHARGPERRFVLAGVVLDERNGPVGHSDADPLCHAVVDALLGAACEGSIGDHFPDTDPRWSGALGLDLLGRAVEILAQRGWRVVNIDAVVVADAPRLAPHVPEIRSRLAAVLRVGADRVSLKGKRAEGLGFEGLGAGVSCRAVALIESALP